MIRLWTSDRLESLLDALAENLRANPGDLFEAPRIVVPNANIQHYLTFGLARRLGIAGNLSFAYLERGLEDLLELKGYRLITAPIMMALVTRQLAGGEYPPPVAAYLAASEPGQAVLRRYELARTLAGLFESYVLQRARMVRSWTRSVPTEGSDSVRWQGELYFRIFGSRGTRSALDGETDLAYRTLDEVAQLDGGVLGPGPLEEGRFHVFGFSYVAPTWIEILRKMGQTRPIELYSFVPTRSLLARAPESNRLIRLWARPGEEYHEHIGGLDEVELEDLPSAPGDDSSSLLARVQEDVREDRHPDPEAPAVPVDESLRMLVCPSIRREAEIVAASIWDWMCDPGFSQGMRFNDIAVIVADPDDLDLYQTHLRAAFRELGQIPLNIIDTPPTSENRVHEAVLDLLSLPGSDLERPLFLGVLTHPAVIPEGHRPEDWTRWCHDAAILRGRGGAGPSFLTEDLHSWDQGCRRLALGTVMAEGPGSGGRILSQSTRDWLPVHLMGGSVESAATLVLLARSIMADVAILEGSLTTLPEWGRLLALFLRTYITPHTPSDVQVLTECLRVVERVTTSDPTGQELESQHVLALVRREVQGMRSRTGHDLVDGVVVSSFLPMRPIPFDVIHVMGMGEGCFPSSRLDLSMDLTTSDRMPGDVDERERDKFLFLETLMSARRRLVLSWVGREPRGGDERQPSGLVEEIETLLRHDYVRCDPDQAPWRRVFPLRRYDPGDDLVARYSHEARLETFAHRVGREDPRLDLSPLERPQFFVEVGAAWRPVLGLHELREVTPPEPAAAGTVRRLSLSLLRRFLEDPLEGWARFLLGSIEVEEEDLALVEDEVFEVSSLERARLLRELFEEGLREGRLDPKDPDLADRVRHALRLGELAGRLPGGLFKDIERRRIETLLSAWSRSFHEVHGLDVAQDFRRVHLGPCPGVREGEVGLPSLKLEVEGRTYEVTGVLQPLSSDGNHMIRCSVSARGVDRSGLIRMGVGCMVEAIVLRAAGGLAGPSPQLHLLAVDPHPDRDGRALPLPVLDPDAALGEVRRWVEDLVTGSHARQLSVAALIKYRQGGFPAFEEEIRSRANRRFGPESQVPRGRSYPCPDPEAIEDLLGGRYRRVLETLDTWLPSPSAPKGGPS